MIYYQDDFVTLYWDKCEDVLPTLNANSIDLIVTDPPYGIRQTVWDVGVPIEWFSEALRVLCSSGAAYVFGNSLTLSAFQVTWEQRGVTLAKRACWVYESGPRSARQWTGKHEDCLVFVGQEHQQRTPTEPSIHRDPRWGNDRFIGDVWHTPRILANNQERVDHPTQKPLSLLGMLIQAASYEGGVVLDPFVGSGSTLVAAKALGRKAIGVEMNERYCHVCAERLYQNAMQFEATS